MIVRKLAQDNVERLQQKEHLEEHEKIMLSGLQRELVFLDMLNLSNVDITGKRDEVEERVNEYEIVVLKKGLCEKINRAYETLKNIKTLIDNFYD